MRNKHESKAIKFNFILPFNWFKRRMEKVETEILVSSAKINLKFNIETCLRVPKGFLNKKILIPINFKAKKSSKLVDLQTFLKKPTKLG